MNFFRTRIRVICFGNRLHGDDGFGSRVYDALRQDALPPEVSLHDAGSAGVGSLLFFEGCQHAILVDAIAQRGVPGRLHHLQAEDVREDEDTLESHGQGVGYLIRMLPMALPKSEQPQVELIAAEVERIGSFHDHLSEPIADAVALATLLVRTRIAELTRQPRPVNSMI